MAQFKGYLVKFGSVELPNSYLKMDSGNTSTPNQREEIKAVRDDYSRKLTRVTANGQITKFSLVFRPLTNTQLSALHNVMNNSLVSEKERKYRVTYWNDEHLRYERGLFYIPDITYERLLVGDDYILYNSFTMEFVGYETSEVVSG